MDFLYGYLILFHILSCKAGLIVLNDYDPGQCNQTNHGAQMLVQDRKNNEKVLICVKNAGVYEWKSPEGDDPNGEIFSPGFDCSKILDNNPKAKDGMYWIHLGGHYAIKVYCDMTTGGGGYFLVGRINNSVTWTVPSNNIPVEPYGHSHWASNLGNAQILDFRVQMGTAEDLKKAKADWSFRLQTKRPLKELMIEDKGCSQDQPGIGDIAYVKDLLTDTIVSEGYRCSVFGKYQHPVTGFGWRKMNSCLNKPCRDGFAYWDHPAGKVQVDFHGSFSFTASGNYSGVNHDATAIVGCSSNKICCACFGPVGGRDHYCSPDCTSKNGGTLEKHSYTWFWVRTSLPKRVWSKCMEYRAADENGNMISYRLIGGNTTPEKGRCPKNKALLNEGVVVVPDAAIDKKAPGVPGLLKYRVDKKEFSIRSNGSWEVIAMEKKILEETSELVQKLKTDNEQRLYEQNRMIKLRIKESEEKIYSYINLLTSRRECNNYASLADNDRNVNYVGSSAMCDHVISTGWYRFVGNAGTQISTSCIPRHDTSILKCSTHGVSWLNGTHPSVVEGEVTREVCFGWPENCCLRRRNIQVINCGLFYIYKLVPTGVCNCRYCGTDRRV